MPGLTSLRTTARIAALACVVALAACSQAPKEAGTETEHAGSGGQHASSSAGLPTGHVDAGAKLAADKAHSPTKQACVDCHGAAGNAPIDASYPKLAGQYADYLAHSLQAYRAGKREHALMSGQAEHLTDQQIADLSAYFGAQKGSITDLQSLELK